MAEKMRLPGGEGPAAFLNPRLLEAQHLRRASGFDLLRRLLERSELGGVRAAGFARDRLDRFATCAEPLLRGFGREHAKLRAGIAEAKLHGRILVETEVGQ